MKLFTALSVAAIVAITLAMCVGHGVASRPILADDQLYFFMTERCASGVPPHVSQMEVKTQLPTLIGGASINLGRRLGFDDIPSGRAATVTATAAAVFFAWLLVLEISGQWGAALVAAAAMFSIYGLFLEAATGFQPKIFMMTFLLAAHVCCAQRRHFATGVAAMAAFLCWQPAALVLASCGLAQLLDRRASWPSLLRTAAGALLVLFAYEAWFAWHGALGAQLHQEWELAFGAPHDPIDWAESFWFVLTESQTFRARANGLPSVFFAATALLWLWMLTGPRRALDALRERPGLVAFWTAAQLTTAFTLYDHQAHPDMLLIQPYFAVSCGIGASWVITLLHRIRGGKVLAAAAVAVFVVLGLMDAQADVMRGRHGRDGLERQLVQADLASVYLDHRGSVWALGAVHLLALNHQTNWVPVGNVGHETSQLDMNTYRPLRDGQMPEIIICGKGLRPGFRSWLPTEYVDITPPELAAEKIRVYSRISARHPGFDRGTAPRATPNPKSTRARRPPPTKP